MDGPCPGLAVFSESSKGPEEDRWKTPPDRSFDGRTPVGAEALSLRSVRSGGLRRAKTLRADLHIVGALF